MVPLQVPSEGGDLTDFFSTLNSAQGINYEDVSIIPRSHVISADAVAHARASGSKASSYALRSINDLPNISNDDLVIEPTTGPNVTIELLPTQISPTEKNVPIYAIIIIAVVLFVMMTTFLYFLCRCMAKRKKRENQLAIITPKVTDPRMAGVRANQPIQFVVPTTIIVSENTEDSVSETDYSSSGTKTLPIILDNRRKRTMAGFHINPEDLQHGLYVGVNEASEKGSFLGDLGKVGFSLSYNLLRSQLTVKLIGATGLPCLFLKTTANPRAKLVLLPDRTTKYMSKVQRNTVNPLFNETFTFSVRRDDLKEKKLKISVWDYDRFSRKCLIGQVTYSIKDSGLANSLSSDMSTGDLWVDLKQDSVSHHSASGEMLFSLCYNPDTANLTLSVLKVRGLNMQQEKGKDTSIYAKVTLYVRRKLVRTKKTPSKRKAPEVEFNNTFNIHVPQMAIGEVDMLVTLCEKSQALGGKRILGRTQVGGNCLCDQGLQHWQDMLTSPKSTCAQWHMLCG